MSYPVVRELAADGVPVATACRVLKVSTSGYYGWRDRPPSERDLDDAYLTNEVLDIHTASHGTYGSRRVHAELRLGRGIRTGRKRIERLLRCTGRAGRDRRNRQGCTRRDPSAQPSHDLVQRNFRPPAPDRLYVADITQHRTSQGWYYLAVVLDCFSRRVIGWAMADHLRAELVVDALQMAIWNRRPRPGTIHHSDHGSQYTSWAFGHRLRAAGLLGSMGTIGDCFDNSVAESFFATLQAECVGPPQLDQPGGARLRGLRLHRRLLQPSPPALNARLPEPGRLRTTAPAWSAYRAVALSTRAGPTLAV